MNIRHKQMVGLRLLLCLFIPGILWAQDTRVIKERLQPTINLKQDLLFKKDDLKTLFNIAEFQNNIKVQGGNESHAIAPGKELTLKKGQYLVVQKTKEPKTDFSNPKTNRFILPQMLGVLHKNPQSKITEMRRIRMVVDFVKEDIRFNANKKIYTARSSVFFEDMDAPTESVKLPQTFEVTSEVSPGDASPEKIKLSKTNVIRHFNIETPFPAKVINLQVKSTYNPKGDAFRVPVTPPAINISITPLNFPGLGVAEASVQVIAPPGLKDVTLIATKGSLEPEIIPLNDEGKGEARLRSSGVGDAQIKVLDQGFKFEPVIVNYQWPLFFLLAAILGGLLGGGVNWYAVKSKKPSVAKTLLKGVLIGLVAATAYAFGINLSGFELASQGYSEALVFTVSTLAAASGLVLRKFKQKPAT